MSRKRKQDAEQDVTNLTSNQDDVVASQNDAAQPSKRRKNYTEEDAKLAFVYSSLSSENADVRIQAAKDLIARFTGDEKPQEEFVDRTLIRLIRGLCSSRKAARLGFFIALVEVLRLTYSGGQGSDRDVNALIDLIKKKTEPEGGDSKQTKKDHKLGLFLSCKAVTESGIIFQSDPECRQKLLDIVLKTARDNVWMRDQCGQMLCEAITSVKGKKVAKTFVEQLVPQLTSYGLAKTSEGVAVWLAAQASCEDASFPKAIWHKDDPLCSKERQNLAKILRDRVEQAPEPDQEPEGKKKKKSQSGHAMPTASFAWDVVLISAVKKFEGKSKDSKASELGKVWVDLVDNNLFTLSSSAERKSWGLQVFAKAILTLPVWALEPLFTPNLMRCILNQRKGSDASLHAAALTPLKQMAERSARDPEAASTFVAQLTSNHGFVDFDKITKTQTVEDILTQANDETLAQITKGLEKLVHRPGKSDNQEANNFRCSISDLFLSMVRGFTKGTGKAVNVQDKGSWIRRLLELLLKVAYFKPNDKCAEEDQPLPAISDRVRDVYKTRLTSILTNFISHPVEQGDTLPYFVLTKLDKLRSDKKKLASVFQADPEVSEAIDHAHATLGSIHEQEKSAKKKKASTLRAVNLLFSLCLLQVYNGDPDAVTMLGDLDEIHQSLAKSSKSKDSGGFELLLDVLLGMISKPSALSRKLSEQVFIAFTPQVTSESLGAMFEILEKKETAAGQEELFEGAPAEEEADEGSEDDDESDAEGGASISGGDDSDVEMIDGHTDPRGDGAEEDSDSDSSSGSDASDDDEGEEDKNDDELAAFDAKLAQTLKTKRAADQEGSDAESSDDEDMDDEQMMALEPALAQIFSQQRAQAKEKKNEKKEAKENVINFKNRVLDLLLLYVKHQQSNTLALEVIIPVLKLTRSTSSKQIGDKASNLLKTYFDLSRGAKMPTVEDSQKLYALLELIHKEAAQDESKQYSLACSRSSLFLARIAVTQKPNVYANIAKIYAQSQIMWVSDSSNKMQPDFFRDWVNWSNDWRKQNANVKDKPKQNGSSTKDEREKVKDTPKNKQAEKLESVKAEKDKKKDAKQSKGGKKGKA